MKLVSCHILLGRHCHQRFQINLIKQVPAQAGLGGGSANAATAMFAVNELLGRPATQEQLVEWSGELGSDITFFFSLGTAYCTGRGEIMTPTDPPLPAGTKLTIVKPDIGLSTPAVFKALDYDKLSNVDPEELLKKFQEEGVVSISDDAYINDLEFPAFKVVPELEELKQQLQTIPGFSHVCMSGSGTSIFCIGEPSDREAFDAKFGPQQRSDLKVFHTEFISRENEQTWWA
jgi:4-diphosphocytidyl-2-C-methyl-D-erythritol kinase